MFPSRKIRPVVRRPSSSKCGIVFICGWDSGRDNAASMGGASKSPAGGTRTSQLTKGITNMANNDWTNTKVAKLSGKFLYSLGDNLCVREKSGGRKYYVFIYRKRLGKDRGKKAEMTRGRTTEVDIKEAQEWAQRQNKLI